MTLTPGRKQDVIQCTEHSVLIVDQTRGGGGFSAINKPIAGSGPTRGTIQKYELSRMRARAQVCLTAVTEAPRQDEGKVRISTDSGGSLGRTRA